AVFDPAANEEIALLPFDRHGRGLEIIGDIQPLKLVLQLADGFSGRHDRETQQRRVDKAVLANLFFVFLQQSGRAGESDGDAVARSKQVGRKVRRRHVIGLAACRIREGVLSGSASSQQGERQGGKRQKKTPQADFKR